MNAVMPKKSGYATTYLCNAVQRQFMDRDEKLATNITPEKKRQFRIEAAKRDMNMSELLREMVDNFLEESADSEADDEKNQNAKTTTADC